MSWLHWVLSKTVREASDMKRQVRMLLNEQRDLLPKMNIANLELAVQSMSRTLKENPNRKAIRDEMGRLEKVANENLKAYPAASVRENVKEILVAITTIMAFTTFFLQLTKIPTGSMQPTLYGITHEDLRGQPDFQIPGFLGRMKDYWVWGIQYAEFIAPEDGTVTGFDPPKTVLPFIKRQTMYFNQKPVTWWLPPDSLFGSAEHPPARAGISPGTAYKKGETVFKVKVVSGDHLLVDRITYNFRHPKRGEIIVFKTRGIPDLPPDQLYIKRLVGLPNEKVQIGADAHLIINDRKLTASDRHFEAVYTPDDQTKRYPYRGHLPMAFFSDPNRSYTVRPGHFMAMGDNTANSSDSRYWGDADQKNIIGKCWFVYWPFTDRFGWGYR